jgi:hypothetical protein
MDKTLKVGDYVKYVEKQDRLDAGAIAKVLTIDGTSVGTDIIFPVNWSGHNIGSIETAHGWSTNLSRITKISKKDVTKEIKAYEAAEKEKLKAKIEAEKVALAKLVESAKEITAPRKVCTKCAKKHVGQAAVLMQEVMYGYPEHRVLAVGHLAEAEAEIMGEYKDLGDAIRRIREDILLNNNPNMTALISTISKLPIKSCDC